MQVNAVDKKPPFQQKLTFDVQFINAATPEQRAVLREIKAIFRHNGIENTEIDGYHVEYNEGTSVDKVIAD